MLTRADAVQALVLFDRPLGDIHAALSQYPWDSEVELVLLSSTHIVNVLERFMTDVLSAADVEGWASTIEGRDDIGFENKSRELLKEAIWELANPILTSALTHHTAQSLLNRLNLKIVD